MNKNYTVYTEDIGMVSVKRTHELAYELGYNVSPSFGHPINFMVRELAIFDKTSEKCVLVREINNPRILETKRIKNISDVGYNNIDQPLGTWITLAKLKEINDKLIQKQIEHYLKAYCSLDWPFGRQRQDRIPYSRREEYQEGIFGK